MEDKPIRDERIVEAIESCRPGSDDVSDPALAFLAAELAAHPELDDLYERCQQLDARLAAAFADVPIPEGLPQRILAGIEAARAKMGSGADDLPSPAPPAASPPHGVTPDEQPPVQSLPATPRRPWRTRRRWYAVAALATGVAAAAVIYFAPSHQPQELSKQTVLSLAIDVFNRQPQEPGEPLTADNEPKEYPFGHDVNRFPQTTFRSIHGFLGLADCDGVAYDMTNRLGTAATLYVVKCPGIKITGLLRSTPPPYGNTFHTQGCCSAAWQTADGLLYVLVVDGSQQQTYESFLPIPGPVT
jgi:hypothetical protein